jgi:hypothetical protein
MYSCTRSVSFWSRQQNFSWFAGMNFSCQGCGARRAFQSVKKHTPHCHKHCLPVADRGISASFSLFDSWRSLAPFRCPTYCIQHCCIEECRKNDPNTHSLLLNRTDISTTQSFDMFLCILPLCDISSVVFVPASILPSFILIQLLSTMSFPYILRFCNGNIYQNVIIKGRVKVSILPLWLF